jgi:hypothetical protein
MAGEFTGTALPLDREGIDAAMALLGVGEAELWTVIKVETAGCGFLADRRPLILFERHKFSKLTGGRFDDSDPDISNPAAGGFGDGGANQYNRLFRAIALDRNAALQSASWGLGQVLGSNALAGGFPEVETMVAEMVKSENAHLKAMAGFIRTNHLADELRDHRWTAFAKGYNGAGFKKNKYDEKLRNAFARFSAGRLPDLMVRDAQICLGYLGFVPSREFRNGFVDGLMGPGTRKVLKRFQADNGLPQTSEVTGSVLAALKEQAFNGLSPA